MITIEIIVDEAMEKRTFVAGQGCAEWLPIDVAALFFDWFATGHAI